MENHRKYKRKTYTVEVTFTVEGIEYQGFSKDIGAGGMFIETDKDFHVGESIRLVFPICNNEKKVELHADIVRNTKDGIGMKFVR